jgi:hypothetical protein
MASRCRAIVLLLRSRLPVGCVAIADEFRLIGLETHTLDVQLRGNFLHLHWA